ncbi:MAG: hypothetical protein QOD55_541 [Solirubrobacteraceae bacterium]|nr:hypothetical protein [Solirubrobacteraceae bacterium]
MSASWWFIVLSWEGREDTLACLRSLEALGDDDTAIVCVDNGSHDGSAEAVRAQHPAVTVIENGRNLGFAGGNNVGIAHALEHGAEWVVLVNNDATVDPGAVAAFRDAAQRHPRAGMLAGKVFFSDPPDRIWFAGQRYWPALGWSGRPDGYGKRDAPRYSVERPTGRAAGAFVAVARPALEAAGLLEEDLFAYVEDVDWSVRVRRAGFGVLFVPAAKAWHHVSASTGGERGSTHVLYYGVRNTIVVAERHVALPQPLKALRRGLVWALFMGQALLLSQGRRRFAAAVQQGFRDARAGRLGARPEG